MRGDIRGVYAAIVLVGSVSLLADMVYEGGRGLIPDYLRQMGASALVVGLVMGLGEFAGYAARLATGYLADVTRAYWVFILVGYGLIAAVPLLSLAGGWQVAAFLVVLERLGKAVRTPARDTVLSFIGKGFGAGKVFGLHELLDQVGAVVGPLMVGFIMLATSNNHRIAFSSTSIPFILMLIFLAYTYSRVRGTIPAVSPRTAETQRNRMGRSFHLFVAAVTLNTIGLMSVGLILYRASQILEPAGQQWLVPMLYLLVQLVDAPMAWAAGHVYDRVGVRLLALPFILSVVPSVLVLAAESITPILAASIVFGVVLGMQESIYRAAVSDLTPLERRGTGYGVFNSLLGLGLMVGGVVFGYFLDYQIPPAVGAIYVAASQLSALLLLAAAARSLRRVYVS